MFYTDTLQSLVEQDQVSQTLYRGSDASWAIRCLQIGLKDLGYGDEMNWDTYMADGGYGGGSTRAVAAFLQKSGISGDGTKVEKPVLQKMLAMLAAKNDLLSLRQTIADDDVMIKYSQDSGDNAAIQGLQRLLFILGYGEQLAWDNMSPSGVYHTPTMAAVKAFGLAENMPTEGIALSTELAKRIDQKVSAWYGAKVVFGNSDAAGRRGADVTVEEVGGKLFAWDQFFKLRLLRHEKGVFVRGSERAESFVQTYAEALKAEGMTDSALRLMVPVSENEGAMDAINTWDNAFLSFGMYQWTMGTGTAKGELPSLLNRIRKFDPDTFQSYYGRFGLGIDEANSDEVYGRVTLNGKSVEAESDKEQFRDNKWAFRFWRAGLDPMIKLVQMIHAFERLYTFYHHPNYLVKGKYFVDQIITSEYGTALILDHHVNRPAHPRTQLGQAMDQTGLASKDPASWTTDDERKLIAQYLQIRKSSSMTDPEKRATITQKYLKEGKLSDERGSFELAPKTKGLESDVSVFPRGLDEKAFPTIRETEENRGTVEPAGWREEGVPSTSSTVSDSVVNTPEESWLKRLWRSIFG